MRRVPFTGARRKAGRYDADENADLRVAPAETTADILEFYARARALRPHGRRHEQSGDR
jgi:hypothetical protein